MTPLLVERARHVRAIRGFFESRGFLEVETPAIVPSPGMDLHLDAYAVDGAWLATSPEYQMKRLVADGFERIFQIGRCFRRGERGAQHNPEFTMVEWYRAHACVEDVMRDTEQLASAVSGGVFRIDGSAAGGTSRSRTVDGSAAGGTSRSRTVDGSAAGGTSRSRTVDGSAAGGTSRSRTIDARPPFARLSVCEAFERFAGAAEKDVLAWAAADEDTYYRTWVERVEPRLAEMDVAVFVVDYPASMASLARKKPSDARFCERFELYVAGLELCNGFGELTDPHEQRARFEHDRGERARRGLPVYPIDERFMAALEKGLPPSAGNALGVDRLVALACGTTDIRRVLAFPADDV